MPWFESFQHIDWVHAFWGGLAAYCLGCFTTGYYLVRARTGLDLRELGSGTAGARNVGRVLGSPGFLLTLAGDFLKGTLAVWSAEKLGQSNLVVSACLLGVVAGHIWPAQLWFRGGKGVATSLGALAVSDFHLVVIYIVVFGIGSFFFRKTVLPGLSAFACLPIASMFMGGSPLEVTTISILTGAVLIAHRKNIIDEVGHMIERRHVRAKPNHTEL